MKIRTSTLPLWRAMIALGVLALAFAAGVVGVREARATLDVPQILVYQGRLTDASRITVADGSYSMKFSLYTASSGGTPVWTAAGTVGSPTAVSVTVTDGIFTYNLGSGANAFDDELFEDNSTLYLGVTIGSDSEMTPRRQVGSAAYAMHAGDSDLLDDLNTDNDGCTTACIPVTSNVGNLTITGTPQTTAVSGGSLYINPASADADEVLFGVALGGNARFSVDEDGDSAFGNNGSTNVAVAIYNSNNTAATLSGTRYIGAYDALTSSGVFESLNGGIFTNGGLSVAASPNTNMAVYVTETGYTGDHGANADQTGVYTSITSNAITTVGAYGFSGMKTAATYSGAATGTTVYGHDLRVSSAPTSTLTDGYGLFSTFSHTNSTLTNGYGVYGEVKNNNAGSTITNAYGVYGYANEVAGTVTTGYGGYFRSVNAGTNYAIYTAEGRVHIEGDATATTPTVATTDGELFAVGDIESDADIVAGSQLAVGTVTSANNTITSDGDVLLGVAAGNYIGFSGNIEATGDGNGGGMDANLYGAYTTVTLSDSAGTDEAKSMYGARWTVDHQGNGGSGRVIGQQTEIDASAGSISSAVGLDVGIATSGGTITEAIGLQIDANSGTDTAIYVARGYVHIDNAVYGSKTAPTFADDFGGAIVGADGTMFIEDNVEIYDGSLCVGDGAADDCGDAAGTDGTIYAINGTVATHDLAEMFPSQQFLTAGEIISVANSSSEHVERTVVGKTIVGAVSTKPGITLGWETAADHYYPIALTGRTPVKVSGENGAIVIGDRVAVSSVAGLGMKATDAGEVVGIAMEAFDGNGQGTVMTFIQPHYWDGLAVAPSVTEQEPESVVQADRVLVMEDGFIRNIMGLQGGGWQVDYDGAFVTEGSYGVLIRGNDGTDVATYGTLSTQQMVVLSGTTKMEGKMAEVKFEDVDPLFNDVVAADAPIVVTATISNGSGTVSIRRKDTNGFELWREGGTGDEVDWIAMAYRKDKAPVEEEEEEELKNEELENVENEASEDGGDAPVEDPATSPDAGEVSESDEDGGEEPADEVIETQIEEPVEEEIEEPVEEPIDEIVDDEEVIEEVVEEEGELENEASEEVGTGRDPSTLEIDEPAPVIDEPVAVESRETP